MADALRNGDQGEHLTVIARAIRAQQGMGSVNGEWLSQALTEVCTELEALWNSLPHNSEPQAVCDAVAALGERSAWGTALLHEAWSPMRVHVRDCYLASEPQLDSFSKLEES